MHNILFIIDGHIINIVIIIFLSPPPLFFFSTKMIINQITKEEIKIIKNGWSKLYEAKLHQLV